jgi:polyisoprenoid-binding protein YceI
MKLRTLMCLFVLAAAVPAAHAEVERWVIDPAHTAVGFSVRHMMVSNVRGTFGKVGGTVAGDPEKPSEATIEATIDAATIDTQNGKRDEHLRGSDFLDVGKHPTMSFKSTSVVPAGDGRYTVNGNLTLHGVTKPVTLTVEDVTAPVRDTFGKMRVGAHATTKINRKDFGINWNNTMDNGGLVVGDEVVITIDVEATKAE